MFTMIYSFRKLRWKSSIEMIKMASVEAF